MGERVNKDVAILGGGLAGVALAHELQRAGVSFVLVEREKAVGGLARTFSREGFGYDIGGHCFHSDVESIREKFLGLLEDDVLLVKRKSTIAINGERFNYPLTAGNAILSLGPRRSLKILADFVTRPRGPTSGGDASFEQWIESRFGKTLYGMYFQPYTEKVWGVPCSSISADWAAQRISLLDLGEAVKSMFRRRNKIPQTNASWFYYPRWGIGQLASRLGEGLGNGNRVLLDAEVCEVTKTDEAVKNVRVRSGSGREEIVVAARKVVSTIPLTRLVPMLEPSPPGNVADAAKRLGYRSMIVVFLALRRERVTEDTWTYYPDRELRVARIHEPGNWSRWLKKPGQTSLCMELFCDEGDDTWGESDEALLSAVIAELEGIGLVHGRDVLCGEVRRVRNAYPIYGIGYRANVDAILKYLDGLQSIYVTGRTGSFKYQNMDKVWLASIEMGRRLVRELSGGCAGEASAPEGAAV